MKRYISEKNFGTTCLARKLCKQLAWHVSYVLQSVLLHARVEILARHSAPLLIAIDLPAKLLGGPS